MGITKKKIIVFTGARSEYGISKPLIHLLIKQREFDTQLVAAGGHLSKSQGYTITEIESDGFPIAIKIDHMVETGDASDVSVSNGKLQIEFAQFLKDYEPDLVIVLGDRSELIPVVSSCLFQSVPVAHISGGEVTEGATDNQVRHAVTKMSHVHFTATEIYRDNILRMGEEPWRICVSGEPGLDDILSTALPSKEAFYNKYGLPAEVPFVIATFHSETIGQTINKTFLKELITALCAHTNVNFLFTAANTDVGGAEINQTLEEICRTNDRITFVHSLGRVNYYAAQKYASLMIGNSSSGLVEAHSFGIPVINVGARQDGRLRNVNVIDVPVKVPEILDAFKKASSSEFRASIQKVPNIYGDGKACERIIDFLKSMPWESLLLKRSTF
jgi:GDP/UDP-N,N'-diacetylbacillosamine 2-epimerase (hydrolysing)